MTAKSVSDLIGVNKRYLKALEDAGITTLDQLCTLTRHDVYIIHNVGTIGMVEIERALRDLGLKLKE